MKIIPHAFNKYEMTEEESQRGNILTLSNQAVIQNLIAEKAEAKLSLQLDPANFNAYIQEEAYLKGQIEILQFLLNMSAYAETNLTNQFGEI